MMPRIVDADPDRNERNININERVNQGNALGELFKAMPWFVWATPVVLLFGLIGLAIWHDGIGGFANGVLGWLSVVPVVIGVVLGVRAILWGHDTFDTVRTKHHTRRLLSENVAKTHQAVIAAEKNNALKDADIEIAYQIAGNISVLVRLGVPFKYTKGGTLEVLGVPGVHVSQVPNQQGQIAGAGPAGLLGAGELPTNVLYETVRGQVPQGHVLVGIGLAGLDTIEQAAGALVWICGLSGTGKTSTTVLRVEERHTAGHKFLGVDPHFFKKDSLTNAVKAYAGSFIKPMARTPEETKEVLILFLDTFYGRKSGRVPMPWQPITLLVDEVGSLMDATDDIEKEIAALLKRIARICGQESRDFNMGGIFISQQATQLAWLRKVALMVFVHQLLMDSEKDLACNGNKEVMKDMERWPRGRTYVYGVGFGAGGARTVQQPYFGGPGAVAPAPVGDDHQGQEDNASSVVDVEPGQEESDSPVDAEPGQEKPANNVIPALSGDLRAVYDACQQLQGLNQAIHSRDVARITGFGKDKANNLITRLEDMNYIPRRRKAV